MNQILYHTIADTDEMQRLATGLLQRQLGVKANPYPDGRWELHSVADNHHQVKSALRVIRGPQGSVKGRMSWERCYTPDQRNAGFREHWVGDPQSLTLLTNEAIAHGITFTAGRISYIPPHPLEPAWRLVTCKLDGALVTSIVTTLQLRVLLDADY